MAFRSFYDDFSSLDMLPNINDIPEYSEFGPLHPSLEHDHFENTDVLSEMTFSSCNRDDCNRHMIKNDVFWCHNPNLGGTYNRSGDRNISTSPVSSVQTQTLPCEEPASRSMNSCESTTRPNFFNYRDHKIVIVKLGEDENGCYWGPQENCENVLPSTPIIQNTQIVPNFSTELPTKNKVEFDELEGHIIQNTDFRENLKSRLTKIGGKDAASHVRNALKEIMTDDVRMAFNWRGRYQKAAIADYKILKVVFEAVQACNYPNSTVDALSEVIKTWLKNVKRPT